VAPLSLPFQVIEGVNESPTPGEMKKGGVQDGLFDVHEEPQPAPFWTRPLGRVHPDAHPVPVAD
jgi:hypothetical protein